MTRLDRHGAVTVVHPTGPLRSDSMIDWNEQLDAMLSGGLPYVVVDLTETPLIDGSGLEWLVDLDDVCCRRGGCLRVCGAGELSRDILRITAVGSTIQQFDDLTSALGSFA
ncbi:MAG: STAS domain-containing protein [Planctomycetota bacterium]